MPTLTPQVPGTQQVPPDEQSPESPPRDLPQRNPMSDFFESALEEQLRVEPQRNPMSDFFESALEEQLRIEQRPMFEGFFSDLGSLLVGSIRTLGQRAESLVPRMNERFGLQSPGEQLLQTRMRSFVKDQEQAQNRLQFSEEPSLFELGVQSFRAGMAQGVSFGTRNLPIVGDFINAKFGPILADLNREAAEVVERNVKAMQSDLGAATVEATAVLGALGGTFTGAYVTIKPWMVMGNMLLSGGRVLRNAGSLREAIKQGAHIASLPQSGFIGDIAGTSLFGAVTGERGLLSETLEGRAEARFGSRLFEMEVDPRDPWWKQGLAQTVNRAEAAVAMGIDDFMIATLFSTVVGGLGRMGTWAMASARAQREALLGGAEATTDKILAMQFAKAFQDPEMRKFGVIRTPSEAEAFIDIGAAQSLISRSSAAQKLLADQQAVEGIISYQSQIAALTRALDELHISKEATHGVLYNVEDAYRLLDDVRAREGLSEAALSFDAPRPMDPVVHEADELVDADMFGYTEGLTTNPITRHVKTVDPRIPLFLRNRPSLPATERGAVEEVIVRSAKTKDFGSWNELLEARGSIDDAVRWARKNNYDVIRVAHTGARGGEQIVVVNPQAIVSSKPVPPEAAGRIAGEPVDAMSILRAKANEPLEVSLKRLLPDMKFDAIVKNDDGSYNIVFSKEGAPGLSGQQIRQLKETNFFKDQRVMYGGKTYEVIGRRGAEGKGKTILLRDPVSGDEVAPSVRNVTPLPSARVEMEVDDALYRDWVRHFDDQLQRAGDRQPDESTLRNIAMATESPPRVLRDYADEGIEAIIYPHEVRAELDIAESLMNEARAIDEQLRTIGTDFTRADEVQTLVQQRISVQRRIQQAAKQAQAEGRIADDIDLDEAFVDFPDQQDYGTIVFNDWLRQRGLELTDGEAQALKYNFYRRLNQETFESLPAAEKAQYRALQEELTEMWESLPDTPETLAHMAGFELIRMKGGVFALRRPGSLTYEGMYSNREALEAALKRSLRGADVPNLTPQYNWLEVSLPSGHGIGESFGTNADDMVFLFTDEAQPYLQRLQSRGGEMVKSKPAWAVQWEEATGIPLWTEFLEPLFKADVASSNAQIPFVQDWMGAFEGLSRARRIEIDQFIRTVESQAKYLDKKRLMAAAKEYGLDGEQRQALEALRRVSDNMFQVGTRYYGWAPFDYIYNYATRMRARHQKFIEGELNMGPRSKYADFVPKELDIFLSKYHREGMLSNVEEDPLVYGLKYIRTFFHEMHVKEPFERMANFIDIRIKDLPAERANQLLEFMSPSVRRELEREFGSIQNAPALPGEIRMPLKGILDYMQGYPDESKDMVVRLIQGIGRRLGMRVSDQGARDVVSSVMTELYGATLAYRPKPVLRNQYQTITNLYPRVGASAVDEGFRRANTFEAFQRGVDDGYIDLRSRGVPLGEELTQSTIDKGPTITAREDSRIWGGFWSGLTHHLVTDGKIARGWKRLAQHGLSGIGKTDMFQRVWSAEAQDAATRPWLMKFLNDDISEAKLRSKGLRYWESSIQSKFIRIAQNEGSEPAMRYIRREAANLANFIYAKTAQPMAIQRPTGRMSFQFGVWPLWRKDIYSRTIRNSRTFRDYFQYGTREAMATAALAAIGLRFGINMSSWMAHNAIFGYTGGPLVSVMADVHNLARAQWDQKWAATKRLVRNNILRLAPPGRLFAEDVVRSIELSGDNPMNGFMHMFYGRPVIDEMNWTERLMRMQSVYDSVQEQEEQTPITDILGPALPLPELQ